MSDKPSDKQHQDKPHDEKVETLVGMIDDVKIGMMSTLEEDGSSIRSRPMQSVETGEAFDGKLWFFTYEQSGKVHEFQRDRHVCVAYSKPADQQYVSVSGTARLNRDRTQIDDKWKESFKAWFPDGKETKGLALIEVSIDKAEYWSSPNSTVVHLYGMAKAALTGKPPGSEIGMENEKVSM